jgi:hypothetical protein
MIPDPKRALVDAVRQSSSLDIRKAIVPKAGSTARQGPGYNGCLTKFVAESWDIASAQLKSQSLARTVGRIEAFSPTW